MRATRLLDTKPKDQLAKYGLDFEKVDQLKREANQKHYKDGVYHRDLKAPSGSIDNPIEVGMTGVSDSLQFDADKGCWILTDGLGNGWIR